LCSCQDNFDGKTEAYKQAFQFIGVMRPQLFEAGHKLDQSKMQVKQYDASTGMLTLAYEYTKANVDLVDREHLMMRENEIRPQLTGT
jgi:hypothetical protein